MVTEERQLRKALDLLIASWVISGDRNRTIPLAMPSFSVALQKAIQEGAFSGFLVDLTFVSTPVGLRCEQLNEIVDLGLSSLLLSAPNPTYRLTSITVSREAAIAILDEHGVSIGDATQWGDLLRRAVDETTRLGSR
jgi:hypothetical protein